MPFTLILNMTVPHCGSSHLGWVSPRSPEGGWSQAGPCWRWEHRELSGWRNSTEFSVWCWWWRWCPHRAQGSIHRQYCSSYQASLAWTERKVRLWKFRADGLPFLTAKKLILFGNYQTTIEQHSNSLSIDKCMSFLPSRLHSPFSMKLLRSPPVSYCSFRSS